MSTSIYIPIYNQSGAAIEVNVDKLPLNEEILIKILNNNKCNPSLYQVVANEYLIRGLPNQYEKLMKYACLLDSSSSNKFTNDAENNKVLIYEASNALLSLVHYHVKKAFHIHDRTRIDFLQSTQELHMKFFSTIASKESLYTNELFISRGIVSLALSFSTDSRDINNSILQFEQTPNNYGPGILCLASCYYYQHKFREALDLYIKVMTIHPQAPPNVRNMMGMCLIALKKPTLAKQCFNISLNRDPNNLVALIGLAHLELNNESTAEHAIELLHRAIAVETSSTKANISILSPFLLQALGSALIYQRNAEATHVLTRAESTTSPSSVELKANCFYELGRCAHLQSKTEIAIQNYSNALNLVRMKTNSKDAFPLAQLGLAQCLIKKNSIDSAILILNTLSQYHPDNVEILKILSTALFLNKSPEAKNVCRRVAHLDPDNVDNLIRMADICMATEKKEAYTLYKKAISRLRKQKLPVPIELWNNIGVLAYFLERFNDARLAFTQSTVSPLSVSNVTAYYNLGRCHEAIGNLNTAREVYGTIFKQFLTYYDAAVRIGVMDYKAGDYLVADKTFKKIFDASNKKHFDSLIYQAILLLETGNPDEALVQLGRGAKLFAASSTYIRLALASCQLELYSDPTHKSALSKDLLCNAASAFNKALKESPSNIYAAHGVGVICAAKHEMKECEDILLSIKEHASDLPDVWLNMAHIRVDSNQFGAACSLYSRCSKQFYGDRDVSVLLYLARSHYKGSQFVQCKKVLQKAIFIAPNNDLLWYNLALAQQESAVATIQKQTTKSVEELRIAVSDLTLAAKQFTRLSKIDANDKHVSRDKALAHATYCNEALNIAKVHLGNVESVKQAAFKKVAEKQASAQIEVPLSTPIGIEETQDLTVVSKDSAKEDIDDLFEDDNVRTARTINDDDEVPSNDDPVEKEPAISKSGVLGDMED